MLSDGRLTEILQDDDPIDCSTSRIDNVELHSMCTELQLRRAHDTAHDKSYIRLLVDNHILKQKLKERDDAK